MKANGDVNENEYRALTRMAGAGRTGYPERLLIGVKHKSCVVMAYAGYCTQINPATDQPNDIPTWWITPKGLRILERGGRA